MPGPYLDFVITCRSHALCWLILILFDIMAYYHLRPRVMLTGLLVISTIIYFYIWVNSLEETRVNMYDFQDTEYLTKCFDWETDSRSPIPSVVHFVWLENSDITFLGYLAIQSALTSLQPDQVKFHHSTPLNEDNIWLQNLKHRLIPIYHDLPTEYIRFKFNRDGD